ncbi:MAG: DNA recombination protein RmuC [Rhodospirillales bacterium]|nr:DNA recombination protein RmuC [Rhodospirillales bacterium]
MPPLLLATLLALVLLASLAALLVQARTLARLKALAEETRAAVEGSRGGLAETERALTALVVERQEGLRVQLAESLGEFRTALAEEQGKLRLALAETAERSDREQGERFERLRAMTEEKLAELRLGNEAKLSEIRKTVNEDLQANVQKRMDESFARVIEQFAAVQKAMGEVQAVTAEIGDIKRIFANVKTRGGWGETQLRAMLDDLLPAGSYEANCRLREESDEAVEFAIRMPARGADKPLLPVDAKFPLEDYERMLLAAEAGDAEAERAARRGIERRVRDEARKIAEKYIHPPLTVEFAVLYLATDGLYTEVARIPGLIEELGRVHKVLILGPSLFPALLRTIQLGFVTLALEQKADEVRRLLGATKVEMVKMNEVLERLAGQTGRMSSTIEAARRRTRVVRSKLRAVEAQRLSRPPPSSISAPTNRPPRRRREQARPGRRGNTLRQGRRTGKDTRAARGHRPALLRGLPLTPAPHDATCLHDAVPWMTHHLPRKQPRSRPQNALCPPAHRRRDRPRARFAWKERAEGCGRCGYRQRASPTSRFLMAKLVWIKGVGIFVVTMPGRWFRSAGA